ncbi:hypothetical protein CW613_002292 [Vibrio mimicus]
MKKLVWLGVALALAGCQPDSKNNIYDVKEVSNRTYLINQETGKLSLVSDGKVIELPTYKMPEGKMLEVSGSFSEKLQFKASTKQVENKIYYILDLEGYETQTKDSTGKVIRNRVDFNWVKPALEKNKYDYIKLQFLDKDGFKLDEKTINLSDTYTNVVDFAGDVTGLKYEGSFSVNPLVLSNTSSLQYVYRIIALSEAPK